MRMGNLERNNYVREQIESATMALFMEKDLRAITIGEITEKAQVSRVSFYRNYGDKAEIVKKYIGRLILSWQAENADRFAADKEKTGNDNLMLSGLFGFLKGHAELFTVLNERGMFDIFRDAFLEIYGPKPEYPNGVAYLAAYAFYGICGWIEEWVQRGMPESEKEMMELLEMMQKKEKVD